MHAGEFEIQTAMMFALMDREKVTDNATGQEMTLYQAYKIVKIDYIALQCKSLITKEEINRDRVDNKGTQSLVESAHHRVARVKCSLKKKTTKYLTKKKKYDIVLPM